jgi:hypothetical protein
MRTLASLVLALILVPGCGGGTADPGTKVCTQIGCFSGFFVSAPHLALGMAQIQASTLEICRNGACLKSSLATWDGTQIFEFPATTDAAHPERVRVSIFNEEGGARFEISYSVGASGPLPDGDTYDVTLTAADGTTPIATHQVVSYARNQPNGPDCGPVCYDAFVQL